jgi:hypothetical protein
MDALASSEAIFVLMVKPALAREIDVAQPLNLDILLYFVLETLVGFWLPCLTGCAQVKLFTCRT